MRDHVGELEEPGSRRVERGDSVDRPEPTILASCPLNLAIEVLMVVVVVGVRDDVDVADRVPLEHLGPEALQADLDRLDHGLGVEHGRRAATQRSLPVQQDEPTTWGGLPGRRSTSSTITAFAAARSGSSAGKL